MMPFYSIPVVTFDSGEWLIATVGDDGTPLGDAFPVGATVYVRQAVGDEYWLLLLGPKPARRFLTGTQVLDFTEGAYPPADDQAGLTAAWEALDPPHAGFLEEGVPRYHRYRRVVIVDSTPVVSQKDWEADWGPDVLELERKNLHPPVPLPPADRQADIDDCLAHESNEAEQSYFGQGGACDRFPYASPADLDRVARELEGLMHARTIGIVEGFTGPGAELLYYLAFKQLMIRKGFKEAAGWGNVSI